MQTTVELPDQILSRTEQAARARGVSVDTLIAQLLERELVQDPRGERQTSQGSQYVSLPIIHSDSPGTLDLSNFDFDDLLA